VARGGGVSAAAEAVVSGPEAVGTGASGRRAGAGDGPAARLNILDNAVKYSPAGVDITAELSVLRETTAMLRITDTGVGIPPEQLKRVFHRFYRVTSRESARIKGTGLGLFITRAIARQHGGDASAQSYGPGLGTTITLQLPLLAAQSQPFTAETPQP